MIYNEDLRSLREIDDNAVDEVVSISSLEHNSPDALEAAVSELMRVLKPGGRLLATLGEARGEDWFHGPSQGWCYSESTLRRVFGIEDSVGSDFARYGEYLEGIRESADLRNHLAPFYFTSGNNGMPWGSWDPQYLSVGISKLKS